MAKTLKMMDIVRSNYDLFDFSYNLYDNSLKQYFEEKFKQHFFLYEIGFETVGLFKQQLQMTLNEIYPYYKQLYETEIRSNNIDFMLNKDLKETIIKEVVGEGTNIVNSTQTSTSNSSSNDLLTSHDTPQNRVDDLDKFMTAAQKSSSSNENSNTGNANTTSSGNTKTTDKTELLSQGNIGITSSAELLQKWRDVLINIDQLIFNDLKSMFLLVY